MRYVIVANPAEDGDTLQYFAGDGFKANLLFAERFRTEEDARRRSENSGHCRRMRESGAKLSIVKVN